MNIIDISLQLQNYLFFVVIYISVIKIKLTIYISNYFTFLIA